MDARPHFQILEEIKRDCTPGLVELLRTEGVEDGLYALWDMPHWHEKYDPCIWRNRRPRSSSG